MIIPTMRRIRRQRRNLRKRRRRRPKNYNDCVTRCLLQNYFYKLKNIK